jgi:L-iditol 2-dehydrogenase
MAARRAAALLAQRLARPSATATASAYNPAPLAASLALRGYSALPLPSDPTEHIQPAFSNAAAVLHGINDLRFEEAPLLPETVAPGAVRVAIKAVGICRSDVHYLQKGHIGRFVVNQPMVIGHESAGTVVEIGEGVQHLQVGDPVAIEPGVPCSCNKHTREGRYNLDPDIKFFATPPHHGSLAQYIDHPAGFCYKLPPGVTHEEGAMCEPLSVGVHAVRRGQVSPGMDVAVIGAGPIGLVSIMAAKAFGAGKVAVVDMNEANLEVARQMGADIGILSGRTESPVAVGDRIKSVLGPDGPSVVIDCAGFEATMQAAVRACSAGGKVVLVGMGDELMKLDMTHACTHEIDLVGSFRYANTYPLCLSLLEHKRVNVKPMITHRFGFTEGGVADGFDTAARSAQTKAIKVMFNLD